MTDYYALIKSPISKRTVAKGPEPSYAEALKHFVDPATGLGIAPENIHVALDLNTIPFTDDAEFTRLIMTDVALHSIYQRGMLMGQLRASNKGG